MNTAARLALIVRKYFSNQSAFADKVGLSKQTVSGLVNGRTSPTFELLEKLHSYVPNLNIHWLVTGQGLMLLKEDAQTYASIDTLEEPQTQYAQYQEDLKKENIRLTAQVEVLKELLSKK